MIVTAIFKCNLGLERRLEDMAVRSEVATRLSRNKNHFNIGQQSNVTARIIHAKRFYWIKANRGKLVGFLMIYFKFVYRRHDLEVAGNFSPRIELSPKGSEFAEESATGRYGAPATGPTPLPRTFRLYFETNYSCTRTRNKLTSACVRARGGQALTEMRGTVNCAISA